MFVPTTGELLQKVCAEVDEAVIKKELQQPPWQKATVERLLSHGVVEQVPNGAGDGILYKATERIVELLSRYDTGDEGPLVWFALPDASGAPPINWAGTLLEKMRAAAVPVAKGGVFSTLLKPVVGTKEAATAEGEGEGEDDEEEEEDLGPTFEGLVAQNLASLRKRARSIDDRLMQQQRVLDGMQSTLRKLVESEGVFVATAGVAVARLGDVAERLERASANLEKAAVSTKVEGLHSVAARLRAQLEEGKVLHDLLLETLEAVSGAK